VSSESPVNAAQSVQQQAEVSREETERRYWHLFEHSLGLICVHDLEGRLLAVNPAAARSLGYDVHQAQGRHLRELLAPDTRHLLDSYLERMQAQGSDRGLMRVVACDGSERVWMYQNVRYEEPGEPPCVIGHALDITDRIRAERALRESEHALKRAYAELDARVQERTAELQRANERLMSEVAERERADVMRERAVARERSILEFLALASEQLTRPLDSESTLATLARLPVPLLADWAVLYLANQDGTFRGIATRHADPGRESLLRGFIAGVTGFPQHSWIRQAALNGRRIVVPDVRRAAGSLVDPASDVELARLFGLGSVVVLPIAFNASRGALALAAAPPERFTEADVAVLDDMMRRFNGAMDRVRLFREAQEANRLKEEFLATLSHELRTPLNAILGWAHILRTRPLDPGTLRGLAVIERNAKAQTRLIEDMLDVSRIVAGKLVLNLEPTSMAMVVGAALDSVRPTAETKGVRLIQNTDDDIRPVHGDPQRLQQVVWNLLSNAIKFTPPGGSVTATVRQHRSHVEVTVSDTGAGIRDEVLPFVFDRFRQADSSTTRSHGGLGLGLSIVRHVIEMHGGTVTAHSGGEGRGATFSLELPTRATDFDTAVQQVPDDDLVRSVWEPLLQGRRVLVVEDQQDARQLIAAIVEAAGASVLTAQSSGEAFDLLARSRPDIVVADIGLPGEDGYALMRRIRALGSERGGDVPAIALTAYARAEDREQALAAGYQRHVTKPVEPQALLRIVRSTLDDHQKLRAVSPMKRG
jgi:PAS domain S-box-containing protein